jgi:TRAP-type C4-dicarboxylate transport system substrate-binding protein
VTHARGRAWYDTAPVRAFALLTLLTLTSPTAAQTVLRMATPIPDGTVWAREIHGLAREIEDRSHGQVRLKVYYSGIAGDEMEVADRIERDQLDGAFSGGMLCIRLAPSMRVMRVLGLFQGRDELAYVLGRLKPVIDEEFRKSGFVNLGLVGVGPELIFSRKPIATLAELKTTRLWSWNADNTLGPELRRLGFATLPATLPQAARLYDEGQVDGFVAAPAAALAFQWSAQAHYLLPLRLASLDACTIISNRFFDPLPLETQQIIRTAAARAIAHLDDAVRAQDEELLSGLFARQGIHTTPVPPVLRAQFFDEARAARDKLGATMVAPALLDRVLSLLADYRAEHRAPGAD